MDPIDLVEMYIALLLTVWFVMDRCHVHFRPEPAKGATYPPMSEVVQKEREY